MFTFSEKTQNSIIILKDSLKAIITYKFVALFAFLIIGINLLIFSVFIDFEYHRYGVNLFDHTTLSSLLDMDFWQHFEHLIIIILLLIATSFITLTLKICLCFIIINRFNNSKINYKTIFKLIPNKFLEMTRFSILKTLNYLNFTVNLTYITSHIQYIKSLLLNTQDDIVENYQNLSNPLLIPILITHTVSIPDALTMAKKILLETFGQNSSPNFSLWGIISFFSLLTITTISIFCHFVLNLHIVPIMIICVLIISSFTSLTATVKLIFDSALYNYCNHQPSGPFTELQIKRLFKIQEDANA